MEVVGLETRRGVSGLGIERDGQCFEQGRLATVVLTDQHGGVVEADAGLAQGPVVLDGQ
ncbi:hypothetical protein D3C83_164720 [compost metagenome]